MKPLTVELHAQSVGMKCMKITGFTEAELSELNSMDYREMKETILRVLDDRNGNLGTCWACGYGVYNAWVSNGAVYVDIGANCD